VDEAHHAAAPSYVSFLESSFSMPIDLYSYRRILCQFNPAISSEITIPPPPGEIIPIIGFSATFGRHDGLSLGTVFEKIVYHRDFLEMIKDQW